MDEIDRLRVRLSVLTDIISSNDDRYAAEMWFFESELHDVKEELADLESEMED